MGKQCRAETDPERAFAPDPAELQAVNDRVLLAGLREQERAAEAWCLAVRLEYQTLHDTLTGLPNRALFVTHLEQTLLSARCGQTPFALFFLDLDRFKVINDRLGHQAGDMLLQLVAARLRSGLRESDLAFRLHGDEFAIILPGGDATAAAVVARRLRDGLLPPFFLQGRPEQVTASIGMAINPEHGSDADTLVRGADAAMYRAKRAARPHAGRGQRGSWVSLRCGTGA